MTAELELPRPQAILLDLDGVLAGIAERRALAAPEDVQAIAARLPIAVVTTCPRRLAAAVLERHGFAAMIRATICIEDGPGKPDPFPVRLALQRLEVEVAWMLGDNPSDVEAARGAGVTALAVRPRGIGAEEHARWLRAAGAELLVDGVAGLRLLLDRGGHLV